jgi:hypothetical protein
MSARARLSTASILFPQWNQGCGQPIDQHDDESPRKQKQWRQLKVPQGKIRQRDKIPDEQQLKIKSSLELFITMRTPHGRP